MHRPFQKNDMLDTKEGRQFRILSLIAEGGFSRIYRAEEIIGAEKRQVLLKAFYENEQIYDTEERDALIRHELRINRQIMESGFTGALTIDYSVHDRNDGTAYGVMTADRPGMTLREYIDSTPCTLRGRIELSRRLCCLVEQFHTKCRMIHGDIAPGNILLLHTDGLSKQEHSGAMALLDFGLTRSIGSDEDLPVGGTEGYTHPELLCGQRTVLLESDDRYSVFACCWFCFSGQSPDDCEITDENIEAVCERLALNAVQNKFVEGMDFIETQFVQASQARRKSILTILKDMFLYSRGEPQRIIALADTILSLLDESAIDRELFTANLREEYLELRQERFANVDIIGRILPHVDFQLSRSATLVSRSKQDRPEPLHQVMHRYSGALFMIGDGGMGKTTSLLQVMDDAYCSNGIAETGPVIFLELYTLPQNPNDWYSTELGGTFIEQFAASYFTKKPRRYVSKDHPYIALLREEFFREPTRGKCEYTILLDGVNEAGFSSEQSRKTFLDALNSYLTHAHNLRIILTSRSDLYELNSQQLQRIYTRGLDDMAIEEMLLSAVEQGKLPSQVYRRILNGRYDFFSSDYRLWQCLQVPFFLMMYCVTELKGPVSRQGEILRNFFNDKRETLDGSQIYGEKLKGQQRHSGKKYREEHKLRMDLSIRVILDHIVPEIALQMVIGDTHFLNLKQIRRVIQYCLDRSRFQAKYQNWCRHYYGYEVEASCILNEIRQIDGGKRIPQYICELIGVMRVSSDEAYSFTHQYFRDYFAACALINRIQTVLEARSLEDTGEPYNLMAGSEWFARLIYPFQRKRLSSHICALVGEILDESHAIPEFCESDGTWKQPTASTQEQSVLTRFLDCYRVAPQNTLDEDSAVGFVNLIAILKGSRVQNDGRADFSGMALHHLDLKDVSLSDVTLSRYNRGQALAFAADFTGSIHVVKALFQNGRTPHNRCIAAHPTKKKILLWNEGEKCVTEYDFEHEETALICSDIEQIHSAFYRQSNDSIFIVSYQTVEAEVEEEPAPASGRSKTLQEFKRLANPYEDESMEEEFDSEDREVQIHMYSRQGSLSEHSIARGETILGANWSEDSQELSIYLQREDGHAHLTVLTIFQIPGVNGEMLVESIPSKGSFFPPPVVSPLVDLDLSGTDSMEMNGEFMFSRVGEGWYVFASPKWPGNVCLCAFASDQSASLLYIDGLDHAEKLHAIYGDSQGGAYYLYGDQLLKAPNSVYPPGIKPFSYSLSTPYGKIEKIPSSEDLLCLNGIFLSRIDPFETRTVWTADIPVRSYFRCGDALIANSTDGIFEINIRDGASVCIQRQIKTDSQFVTGITDQKDQIILLDGTGIIKWIDVHTGCCVRQSTIQMQSDTKDTQIYSLQKEHEIWGLSGRRYSIWDDRTGALKSSSVIPDRTDGDFLWAEITEKKILVYFRKRDYSSFPLKAIYFCRFWDVKDRKWCDENPLAQCEEIKFVYLLPRFRGHFPQDELAPFKIHFSDNRLQYLDRARPVKMEQKERVLDKTRKGFRAITVVPDENYVLDDFTKLETEKISKPDYDFGDIEWDLEPWDRIAEQEHMSLNTVLYSGESLTRRLGVTDGMFVYAYVDVPSDKCNLLVRRSGKQFQYQLTQLRDSRIKHTWATDGVMAFHVCNRITGMEGIVFWDIKTTQVYFHRAVERISAAGCTGVKDSDFPQKDTQDLLHMQGIGKNECSSIGASTDASIHNTLEQRKFLERIKSWNCGAMLFFMILTGLNGWFIFSGNSLSIPYYETQYIQVAASFAIFFFAAKAILPPLTVRVHWHDIYGIAYLVFAVGVIVLSAIQPYNYRFEYLRRNLLLIGIPFIAIHILYSRYAVTALSFPILVFALTSLLCNFLLNLQDNIIYLEMYVLIIVVLVSMLQIRIKKRPQFIRILLVYIMCFIILSLISFISGRGPKLAALSQQILQPELHEPIVKYCRDVRDSAMWIGPASVPTQEFFSSYDAAEQNNLWFVYLGSYFLNYVLREYGWLALGGCIVLELGILVFLWAGTREQKSTLDRCICMSCTLFILFETVLAVFSCMGFQFIPPNCMPFFSSRALLCSGSYWALCIYMSFYHAHRPPK